MRPQTSILRTLSRRSFRANRRRNLVAILAIILTTMMFTSLFVLSQSMIENMQQMYIQQAGYSSQLSSSLLTDDEADAIAAHPAVAEASRSTVVGVAENVSGRQVELRAASADYADSALSLPTEGRMPENADEIALDTITLDKLGLAHQLGETVHLSWTSAPGSDAHETADFTLCGIWQGNPAAMASMAWVSEDFAEKLSVGVDQNAARESGSILGLTMLHIDLVDDSDPSGTAEKILADTGLSERVTLSPNIAYDSAVGQNMLRELLPMAICMVLVFVSGYLIIYNIFQISVAADIRFYGRLKTLGATKRQLKKIIYSQARRLCLVGIPFGLVIGYFLGAVLVPFMITSTGGAATVALDPWIFVVAALFAAVTVRISCLKPARTCGKVSPMEALRYTDAEPLSRRKRKKSHSASVRAMAWANLGRNRKRTVLVIASLSLGLVLLSGIYAKNASFDIDKYMSGTVISDFEVEDASIASNFTTYDPQGTTINSALVEKIGDLDGLVVDTLADAQNILAGNFDKEAFASGGYVVVDAGPAENTDEIAPTYNVGDSVTLGDKTYEVMAIVRDITPITEGKNSDTADFLGLYIPAEDFCAMYPDNTLRKYFFDVAAEDQPAAEQMLLDVQAEDDPTLSFTSKQTLIDHYKEQTRASTIMAFAISFVIAVVGVLNFVNSMLTAIFSRQKEFAMLQSIGMTRRQLRNMLIDEGLYYAGITLVLSYLLSALVVGVGVRLLVAGDWTATFHFTLLPLVICTPILFAFAVLIPVCCFKNIEKQSIVERLRAVD